MKTLYALLAGWLALAVTAGAAPIEVEVVTDQSYFLPDESMIVGVRIANLSGQTLHFGKDDNWVSFFVESLDRTVSVRQQDKLPAKGEFAVESSTRVTRRFDLAPCFALTQPGRYRITATLRIQEWSEDRTSAPKEVDVLTGTTLWEQEFGVPKAAGAPAGPPEIRKYILQQARLTDQLKLYLRVTDAHESKVFRVVPVDRLVSISKPEVQLDRQSNLHLLHQTGQRVFNYSVFSPDGTLLVRQQHLYHELNGSRPRLQVNAQGDIGISGGARRLSPTDVPPPSASPESAAPLSPQDAGKPNK